MIMGLDAALALGTVRAGTDTLDRDSRISAVNTTLQQTTACGAPSKATDRRHCSNRYECLSTVMQMRDLETMAMVGCIIS